MLLFFCVAKRSCSVSNTLQEHDSYSAFRSHGLNVKISLDAGVSAGFPDISGTPSCLLYNSTVRWFDQLKVHYSHFGRELIIFICLSTFSFASTSFRLFGFSDTSLLSLQFVCTLSGTCSFNVTASAVLNSFKSFIAVWLERFLQCQVKVFSRIGRGDKS